MPELFCRELAARADCTFGSRCGVDLNWRDMVTVSSVSSVLSVSRADVGVVDRTSTVSQLTGRGGYDISWSVQFEVELASG